MPDFGQQFLGETLTQIDWILQQNFLDEEGRPHTCIDNAISTLGKCIYYQNANPIVTA